MSEEIIDVTSQEVGYIPQETKIQNGMVVPDPTVVEVTTDEETTRKIAERRAEMENVIPEYPREWQEESGNSNGFDDDPTVNVSLKEKEVKKIIKKYKRYMKSNLKEIRRVDS